MKLIATQPFAEFNVGDEITDAKRIKEILDSEQAAFVVQVAADADTGKTTRTVALKG